MPSNYITGSNVYPKQREEKTLLEAGKKLERFNLALAKREASFFELIRDNVPWFRTAVMNFFLTGFFSAKKVSMPRRPAMPADFAKGFAPWGPSK